ncbi:MAG TPA: hypothetical protein DCP25_13065 [Chloroflexi bacterium]|jgi:hypothetical protein|nr:hypothetical protein [Chloroflexota bacterium]
MPRHSVGGVAQSNSRTALFAYIAARLHGCPVRGHDAFFSDELGVIASRTGAEKAARPYRDVSERKLPRGTAAVGPTRREPVLRDWLLIDEQRLDLETVLLRFPGDGRRQSDLLAMLNHLPGIRQVIETASRREVVAIAVFRDAQTKRRLRAALEEVAEHIIWEEVLTESHEPALRTWQVLTRAEAADENRLV